jgi:NADPH:quinone reductase-like Zn-dependent oxidoreductase
LEFGEEVAALIALWREGRIKPLISRTFAFEDAAKAIALMRGRGAIGKLVVAVG